MVSNIHSYAQCNMLEQQGPELIPYTNLMWVYSVCARACVCVDITSLNINIPTHIVYAHTTAKVQWYHL